MDEFRVAGGVAARGRRSDAVHVRGDVPDLGRINVTAADGKPVVRFPARAAIPNQSPPEVGDELKGMRPSNEPDGTLAKSFSECAHDVAAQSPQVARRTSKGSPPALVLRSRASWRVSAERCREHRAGHVAAPVGSRHLGQSHLPEEERPNFFPQHFER